jgi:hypothetical protein
VVARFKPLILEVYVFVGCDDTYPSRRGVFARVLGVRRNATMVGENIVPAPDHLVHRGRFLRMTRGATLQLLRIPSARTDQPFECSFEIGKNPSRSCLAPGFQDIPDFRKQLLFGRRTGGRYHRLLEAVYLLDDEEKAKSDDEKFNDRINEHAVGENGDSSVGSLPQRGHVLAVQHDKQIGKVDSPENQAKNRHKDVINQRSNNLAECGTYDDPDCEVDDISLKCKFPEFFKP